MAEPTKEEAEWQRISRDLAENACKEMVGDLNDPVTLLAVTSMYVALTRVLFAKLKEADRTVHVALVRIEEKEGEEKKEEADKPVSFPQAQFSTGIDGVTMILPTGDA